MINDNRLVYGLALIVAITVGYFYYHSGKSRVLEVNPLHHLSASATGLQLVATNPQGQLALTAQVGNITQWADQDRTVAQHVKGLVYHHGIADLEFEAQQATATDQYRWIELDHEVNLQRRGINGQTPLSLTTQRLKANTQTQQIRTDDPVFLRTSQAQLTSQGLIAHLQKGDYQLFNIRGHYEPIRP